MHRILLLLSLVIPAVAAGQSEPRTRNVILVVPDGIRWQEVFRGADSLILFGDPRFLGDTAAIRRDFWRATAAERREALFPFLWNVVARDGQLFGNRDEGSHARITNDLKFSYPGYNEMLSGAADPRIRSNAFGPNPNVTVFEWLASRPGFAGRVAAFATWDAFADIFNRDRAGIHVHAGWEPPFAEPLLGSDSLLNRLFATTFRLWANNTYDAFTQAALLEHLRFNHPRVLFVGYGETDEWAHAGRYDRMLRAARSMDGYVAELWATLQEMPEYRGSTTLIVTTDHGRGGAAGAAWQNHGARVDGAEDIWIAVLGPDTPPLGSRRAAGVVTQSQVAATIAALLGQDFVAASPGAAPPIRDVLGSRP